jgi:hypothetical protein
MTDITFDSLFMVLEVPEVTPGGTVSGVSYDGENYDFTATVGSGGEVSTVFIT